jgi:hypothetical protein
MAFAYDPKTSGVVVQYTCSKNNNSFHWITQKAWNEGYNSQIVATCSPKGAIFYEDGTTPVEPNP